MDTISTNNFLLPSHCKRCVFDSDDLEVLKKLYTKLHPQHADITVNSVYKKYSHLMGRCTDHQGSMVHASLMLCLLLGMSFIMGHHLQCYQMQHPI